MNKNFYKIICRILNGFLFEGNYYIISYLETSTKLDKMDKEVSSLREIKIDINLSLEQNFVKQKELTQKERLSEIMRKTEMAFSPSKYGVMLPSPSPSKAIPSTSSSTLKADVLWPLPESTKEDKPKKEIY